MSSSELDFTSLERIVPGQLDNDDVTGQATLDLHMARYRFAAGHVVAGTLLDIACGVGYGTHFLTAECARLTRATGVDIAAAAIDYARARYEHPRIDWRCEDAARFQDAQGFDNIVSLETIEHLPAPGPFFRRIAGLLKPGGILIASVPSTPSMDGNPHHLSDFSEASFRRLAVGLPLREVACFRQVQPFSAARVVTGREKRLNRTTGELMRFYLRHPQKIAGRAAATLRHGFVNRYLTVAWTREH